MTLNQAKDIYKKDFWHSIYDDIIHSAITIKTFDYVVNMSHKHSHLILQRSINFVGHRVIEDGLFGQETLSAVNKSNPELLLKAIKLAAEIRYHHIVTTRI